MGLKLHPCLKHTNDLKKGLIPLESFTTEVIPRYMAEIKLIDL